MCNAFGGPEKPFPASKHILWHFRPNVTSLYDHMGMQKIAILAQKCKKFNFVQSGRKCPDSHHMAGNGYLGYRGPILHRDSISKHVLKGFRENRKKSIFEILICGSPHYEYWNFNFPAKYRPYDIGGTFKHLRPLFKPKCISHRTFIWFLQRIMWFLEKSQKLWFFRIF